MAFLLRHQLPLLLWRRVVDLTRRRAGVPHASSGIPTAWPGTVEAVADTTVDRLRTRRVHVEMGREATAGVVPDGVAGKGGHLRSVLVHDCEVEAGELESVHEVVQWHERGARLPAGHGRLPDAERHGEFSLADVCTPPGAGQVGACVEVPHAVMVWHGTDTRCEDRRSDIVPCAMSH